MSRLPLTNVRTSHALTIRANGITVGMINGWNPSQGRTATSIFEVGADDSGNPVEIMPGNANSLSITVSRYDTYPTRLEKAFGTPDLVMLTRQNQPFDVVETWAVVNRNSLVNKLFRVLGRTVPAEEESLEITQERFLYTGCWFTSLGRTLRSDDNRIVNVNATLVYTRKLKVTGITANVIDAPASATALVNG